MNTSKAYFLLGLFFHFPTVTDSVFYGFSMLFSLSRIILCDTDQERNQKGKKSCETEPVKRENLTQIY